MLTLLLKAHTWSLSFEDTFIIWLQSLGGRFSFLYYLNNFFSFLGESTCIAVLIAVLYFAVDKKKAQQITFTLSTSLLTTTFIKDIVCRTRPFNSNPNIQNFRLVGGYSFPSGHSTNSSAVYATIGIKFHDKKRRWLTALCVAIPLLVALSRMYVGAHYPTDVITGLALGTAFAFLINWLLSVMPNKYWVYCGGIVLMSVGLFTATDGNYFTMYGILCGLVAANAFEEKFVNFEETHIWWRVLLRLVGVGLVMLALDTLIKLPFASMLYYTEPRDPEQLATIYRGATAFDKFLLKLQGVDTIKKVYADKVVVERVFRTVKYAILAFVALGVYPMLFKPAEKLYKKLGWIKTTDTQTTTTTTDTTTEDTANADAPDKK